MDKSELKKLIEKTTEERLREIVNDWIENNDDFRSFVEQKLNPPIDEIDFDAELAKALMHEANQCVARRGPEILDWSNIYYYHIEPWAKLAESLKTYSLWNLVVAIIGRVAMAIDDEDFMGDDWSGDDYSQNIDDILNTLGNLCGLLIIREDLTEQDLENLLNLVMDAEEGDKIHDYLDTPYNTMLDLINVRKESEEISCGLYDIMIEANFDREAGKWICRKIDFIRSMGWQDEAYHEMSQNLRYPDVALKYYNELLESERWDDAIALLDKAQGLRQDESNRWLTYGPSPDWLAMKQQLLMEHGSISARIENLKALFHHTYDEEKRWQYYEMLRNMIPDNEWKDFYTNLLRSETGYGVLDKIAPFLIKEGEYEWLYRLIAENEIKDKTDYRTPLKYSSVLIGEYDGEMRAMMVRTFRNYAADRFGYKKKVKTGKYSYFCEDLAKLADFGMDEELQELVTYFKDEYKTRPSLMTELRKIKTK